MIGRVSFVLLPAFVLLGGLSAQPSVVARKDQGLDMEKLNAKNTSLVVIDVQNYFIPGYPGAISPPIPGQNEAQKLANVLALIKTAKKQGLTTFVTFEASKQGIDAMPDELKRELPTEKCSEFIKQYFDLTKKPEVSAALEKAGTKNVLVCGAETDVCVMQSATGLIKKGYRVYLAEDAVYTSTTLNEPALERMQMAGVHIVQTAEAIRAIENSSTPAVKNTWERRPDTPDIEADTVAAVIVNYDDESLEKVSDPKKAQKKVRMANLNHYAEVLEIPVYYLWNGPVEEIKKDMYLPLQARFLQAPDGYRSAVQALAAILQKEKISQVVLGGIEEDQAVTVAASVLTESGFQVHLMEDVVFKDGGTMEPDAFAGFYLSGAIPSSFKMFIYDATEGIQAVIKKRWREMFKVKLAKKEITWVDELPFVKDSQ
jgi:nicotinamidase-related amidase